MRKPGFGVPLVLCLLADCACLGQAAPGAVRHLLQHVQPVFPDIAKRTNVEGTVILRIVIDPQGRVVDVRLASGNSLFVKSAMDAVKGWRYTSADDPSVAFVQVNFGLGKAR